MPIVRQSVVIVTNPDGTYRIISTAEELNKWLEGLSPAELQLYKDRYRFEPVRNKTGIPGYTGTIRDL
jgi:histidinol phosphatase-like enzyme